MVIYFQTRAYATDSSSEEYKFYFVSYWSGEEKNLVAKGSSVEQ
jgi:hypothetical protein